MSSLITSGSGNVYNRSYLMGLKITLTSRLKWKKLLWYCNILSKIYYYRIVLKLNWTLQKDIIDFRKRFLLSKFQTFCWFATILTIFFWKSKKMHNRTKLHFLAINFEQYDAHYLKFLWQVEFWLANNLLLTLHGSRAVLTHNRLAKPLPFKTRYITSRDW